MKRVRDRACKSDRWRVGGEAAHMEKRPRVSVPGADRILEGKPVAQPRRAFADAELSELADSIKQHGVIQPIVVRPVKGVQRPVRDHRRRNAAGVPRLTAGLHEG